MAEASFVTETTFGEALVHLQRPDVRSEGSDYATVVVTAGHFDTDHVFRYCVLLAPHDYVVVDYSATLKLLAVQVVDYFAKGTFRVDIGLNLVFEELQTVVVGCDGFEGEVLTRIDVPLLKVAVDFTHLYGYTSTF